MLHNRITSEESGFSLIELLVVVLIIGILAAVMIPRFFAQRDSAKNGAGISTIRDAETALNTYFMQHGENFVPETGSGTDEEKLAQAMGNNNAPGREKGFVWTGHVAAGPNFLMAGNSNNPKQVWIEDVQAGRYGGVLFCTGSQGTKNYCAAILANGNSPRWTLIGEDNSLLGASLPVIHPGTPSTPATSDTPKVTKDMTGTAGTNADSGWST